MYCHFQFEPFCQYLYLVFKSLFSPWDVLIHFDPFWSILIYVCCSSNGKTGWGRLCSLFPLGILAHSTTYWGYVILGCMQSYVACLVQLQYSSLTYMLIKFGSFEIGLSSYHFLARLPAGFCSSNVPWLCFQALHHMKQQRERSDGPGRLEGIFFENGAETLRRDSNGAWLILLNVQQQCAKFF